MFFHSIPAHAPRKKFYYLETIGLLFGFQSRTFFFRKDHVFWSIYSSFESRMTNQYLRIRDLFEKNRFWNANKRPIVSRNSRYNWSFVRIPEPILFRKDHVFWSFDSSFEIGDTIGLLFAFQNLLFRTNHVFWSIDSSF